MPKLVCLDTEFIAPFRRKLHGGLGLGWRLSERKLTPCTLAVWLPDDLTTAPLNLDYDFERWERPFDIRKELFSVLDAHLREPGAVVIADTSRGSCGPRPQWFDQLTWFTCEPLPPAAELRMCAVVEHSRASDQVFEILLREASPYATVLTLSSLPAGVHLGSGDHLDAGQLEALMDRVERILVGVYDERSMMLWTRRSPRASWPPCPEIA